jgi:hypothetical protein
MTNRDPAIQSFLSSVRDTLAVRDLGPEGSAAIDRIFGALALPESSGSGRAQRLSVCGDCLPTALATARRHSPALARIVDAFQAIEPGLVWAPRSVSGANASANWPEGHANAMIVGPGGLESRNDVHIGVSLLAPNVRYPDHNHAPEEVYLVLSPGRFQHGESGWFEPGIGGTLYNEPNIRHAMASDDAPLFALWLLWTGMSASRV